MHLSGQILLCQQTVPTRMHWILPLTMISHKATHNSSILDLLLTRELNIVFDITVGRSPSGNSDYHCLNAINELPVKFITLPFFSRPRFDGLMVACEISAIWGRFPLNFAFKCWTSAIFLFPACLTYWPGKYTTRVDHGDKKFHQVWCWYDHEVFFDPI